MLLRMSCLLLLFCFISLLLNAQNKTYQIKADSVRIFSNCDTAELILQNRTRNILNGVLFNKGNGVTEFRKILTKINSNTYLVGGDSLHIDASGGSNGMAWLLEGNTTGSIKKLGTLDNIDLPFITSGYERMRITSTGNMLLGTSSDNTSKLQVNGNMSVANYGVFNNTVAIGDINGLYGVGGGITGGGGNAPVQLLGSNQGWASSMVELGCVFPGALKDIYNTVNEAAIVRIKGGWGNTNVNDLSVSTLAIEPVIGISGGSGTTVRGIYYNPVVNSTNNGIHIAFQNTSGNNIFNSLSGNTLIGSGVNTGSKLQVNGAALVNITNDAERFTIKSSGLQNWRPLADFNVTDADGISNSFGLKITGYNQSPENHIISFEQYNTSEVRFNGSNYSFENKTIFNNGINSTYHRDFDITLKYNTLNPTLTGIKFYTENAGTAPSMAIMQNGRIGVGTTSPAEKLDINGNIKTAGFIMPAGAVAGYVLGTDANGIASWQTPGTLSDLHLKENIVRSQFNSAKLLGLSIRDFNYKSDKNKTRYTGLIAQELKTVIPELVLGQEGSYSIDYVKMVPYLLKAIQDQQAMLREQQIQIDQLKQQPANKNTVKQEDLLSLLQQQLLLQQEEIKLLKEQVKTIHPVKN